MSRMVSCFPRLPGSAENCGVGVWDETFQGRKLSLWSVVEAIPSGAGGTGGALVGIKPATLCTQPLCTSLEPPPPRDLGALGSTAPSSYSIS